MTENKEKKLFVTQTGFDGNENNFRHVQKEIIGRTIDFVYTIGDIRITEDSFGKAFLAKDNILDPIVCSIGENAEELLVANEKYLSEKIAPLLEQLKVAAEQKLNKLAEGKFILPEKETNEQT